MLDALIPTPRLLEVDHVDVAASPETIWQHVRHGDLASSPLIHALFELRAMPERLAGHHEPSTLLIDDLRSTPEQPGFQVLLEDAPYELSVGAIGKVWHAQIPFVHVANATAFAAFHEPDYVKVAWSIRITQHAQRECRVEFEVRVDATDDEAWHKFERYFRLIGPASHFIRRVLLADLARELGSPEARAALEPLAGDDLLRDARAETNDSITIEAPPSEIWPWLMQIGCRRAGYYSIDLLDNGGERSSRELVPELQRLRIGQVIPATPHSDDGFEVLRLEAPHALVLGGLYDPLAEHQLPFAAQRPADFWQVTWAFVLEPLSSTTTRLHVRARAAFSPRRRLRAAWIRPVHHLMQRRMLQQLAARVEHRLPRDDTRDVVEGLGGAAIILANLLTPFLRRARSHWGVTGEEARAPLPGDELVSEPDWAWTHGVEIAAPAARVWRWVAQIGANRAGFYSYQFLENLAGSELVNADAVHPTWELTLGDKLVLHPKVPPLEVTQLKQGRYFVAYGAPDAAAQMAGKAWASASWLFLLEPLGPGRCRLLTRYRVACSRDVASRLAFGPLLLEPIGFAMDRRMLLGIKQRAEREARYALVDDAASSVNA